MTELPRYVYSVHHGPDTWKHDDACCTYVCTYEKIDSSIHESKSTDVIVCIPQRTLIFRYGNNPEDYRSGNHISMFYDIDESIRSQVFSEVFKALCDEAKPPKPGYYGCEVHMKPEGRCPNDGQECSVHWYD